MLITRYFNNVSSLQFFHLLRFTSFLLISIVFTKSHLTRAEIADFEIMLFLASLVSYFWVTGLIQSFLSLYNDNKVFSNEKRTKSPEIFNVFILISVFSILIFVLGHVFKNNIYVYSEINQIPYANLLLLYILFSNPVCLVEYIYLLKNKSSHVVYYSIAAFTLQCIFVVLPIMFGYGIKYAFIGLLITILLRFVFLIFLLIKYAEFKFSPAFIRHHLSVGYPLIISILLSGSAQYIDGILVANKFSAGDFAYFRYGAKELPLVVMLATGLHSAMIPEFSLKTEISIILGNLKKKSKRLINSLFPISIVMLLASNWLFIHMFNPSFRRSADIFMLYLLLILSRLVFPQTILIGLKRTKIVMIASIIEIIFNVLLSLYMIEHYGLQGVVVATVIIFALEKMVLVGYNYFKLGIKPNEYIPVKNFLIFSALLILFFVLIDHRIIVLY